MAFSMEGLTFGDFGSLTPEEYTELFGTGSKHPRGNYLELPWDEEENLQSVLRPLQQGVTITQSYGVQQQQPQQPQQPQGRQQVQQIQNLPYQPAPQQHPQQHLQQHPQQLQSATPPLQKQVPQGACYPHKSQQSVSEKQYADDKQTLLSNDVATHPTTATKNVNAMVVTMNTGPQQGVAGSQVHMHPRALPAVVQAEAYAEKMEEGAQSSDGGNAEGDVGGDGKRRRNKKRRDPNYYKYFYENYEKPASYGSTETAYYADNESSSGSSGTTSEVHSSAQDAVPETVIDMKPPAGNEDIARGQMEPNVNFNSQLINQPSNITHQVSSAAVHMQQQVNRTSGMHHEGYVTHPTYTSVQDGASVVKPVVAVPLSGGQSLPAGPLHGPPAPGLQHTDAAATIEAVQLQKSQITHAMTATTTNVQNVTFQYRTTQSGEGQALSAPVGDIKPSPSSSAVIPKKTDNAGVMTSGQNYQVNTTPESTTLNAAAVQNLAKETATPVDNEQYTVQGNRQSNVPSSAVPVSVSSMPPQVALIAVAADKPIATVSPVQTLLPVDTIPAPTSSPPASSSTSATPGSSTPIASPTATPVASPPVTSPTPIVPADSAPVSSETATAPTAPAPAPVVLAPAPAAAPTKPTSWAGLFKSSSAASTPSIITAPYNNSTMEDKVKAGTEQQSNSRSTVSPSDDPRAKELAGVLSSITLSNRNAFLRPRGLTNIGNWCYINSILQALVACPPLTNLIRALPYRSSKQQDQEATSTPMLNALIQFFNMFSTVPLKIREKGRDIRPGPSFEPTMIYHMLSAVNISLAVKQGRQEDAEEFLSCLLNGLHEEMLAVMGSLENKKCAANTNGPACGDADVNNKHSEGNHVEEKSRGDEEDDEWERVGPKNKSSVTRGAHFTQTPLSKIFGGQMRSALHQQGSRESATLQPFFTLQLDIQDEKIWSVRDALDNLGLRESLQGFTCNKTKMEVEASRRITLEELPPVLILHLKCFVYDKTGGCQKLIKKLDYNMDLEISKDLLSPSLKTHASVAQRSFRLMAVIYHVGKEASGGHYITDVFHAGLNSWMRMDDSQVRFIKGHQVVKPQSSLTPYLLFYRRNDCASAQS